MPDARKTLFTLDTLGDLDDGATRLIVDQALADALADCDARPALDKARRLTITIEMLPVLNQTGGMKGVTAEAKVKLAIPATSTNVEYLPTTALANGHGVEAYLPFDRPAPLFQQANTDKEPS